MYQKTFESLGFSNHPFQKGSSVKTTILLLFLLSFSAVNAVITNSPFSEKSVQSNMQNIMNAIEMGTPPNSKHVELFWDQMKNVKEHVLIILLADQYHLSLKKFEPSDDFNDSEDEDSSEENDVEQFQESFVNIFSRSAHKYGRNIDKQDLLNTINKSKGSIDSLGNKRINSKFESLLAREVVLNNRNLWEAPFLKLNHSLTEVIKKKISIINDNSNLYTAIDKNDAETFLYLIKKAVSDSQQDPKNIKDKIQFFIDLINKKPFDLIDVCHIYKYLFENIDVVEKNLDMNTGSLLNSINRNELRDLLQNSDAWTKMVRPSVFFDELNRGREKDKKYLIEGSRNGGITDDIDTPIELIDFHRLKIERGKQLIIPNEESPVVQQMRKLGIPYVAGASGTVGYYLWALFQLVDMSYKEMDQFMIGVASYFVLSGHHSYFEIMVIRDVFYDDLNMWSNIFDKDITYLKMIKNYLPSSFWQNESGKKLIQMINE